MVSIRGRVLYTVFHLRKKRITDSTEATKYTLQRCQLCKVCVKFRSRVNASWEYAWATHAARVGCFIFAAQPTLVELARVTDGFVGCQANTEGHGNKEEAKEVSGQKGET